MELSITELLQQSRERKTQQTLLPALRQKSNEVIAAYGEREKFLTTFNPDLQREVCAYPDVCFFGGAPTLGLLNTTYGNQTAAMWLVPQLYNLSEYCGCKDKLSGSQLKECASVIASEFHYLSVTELMLFFHRFKSGRYGRFYGAVDPLIITESLRKFLGERIAAYDEHDKEEKKRKEEEDAKNAISWEEFCMREFGEIRPHPLSRKEKVSKSDKEITEEEEQRLMSTVKFVKSVMTDPKTDDNTKAIFSNLFKQKYGITPQEFIDKNTKI